MSTPPSTSPPTVIVEPSQMMSPAAPTFTLPQEYIQHDKGLQWLDGGGWPDQFSGDPTALQFFLTRVQNNAKDYPSSFPTEEAMISFAVQRLQGPALEWYQRRRLIEPRITTHWSIFTADIALAFPFVLDGPSAADDAEAAKIACLVALRQQEYPTLSSVRNSVARLGIGSGPKGTVPAYFQEFASESARAGVTDNMIRIRWFRDGLLPELREYVDQNVPREPALFVQYAQLVMELEDKWLQERSYIRDGIKRHAKHLSFINTSPSQSHYAMRTHSPSPEKSPFELFANGPARRSSVLLEADEWGTASEAASIREASTGGRVDTRRHSIFNLRRNSTGFS